MKATSGKAYVLREGSGVTDVWFPLWAGRYTTKVGAEQTDGRLLQLLISEPRGAAPPLHVHHDSDETWYVIEGTLTVFAGDERIEAGPGDFIIGPMGVQHSFLVTSERAELLVAYSPAGTRGPSGCGADGFFREIGLPVVAGQPHPGPVRIDPEEFARKAIAYGIEVVGPPPSLD